MAKATRVGQVDLVADDEDEVEKEPQSQPEPSQEPVNQILMQRVEMFDMALLEISRAVEEIQQQVGAVDARLNDEKEARISASMNTIANMDQDQLSELLFTILVNKYLDFEQNDFNRLSTSYNTVKTGMVALIKTHKFMVDGITEAIRYSH